MKNRKFKSMLLALAFCLSATGCGNLPGKADDSSKQEAAKENDAKEDAKEKAETVEESEEDSEQVPEADVQEHKATSVSADDLPGDGLYPVDPEMKELLMQQGTEYSKINWTYVYSQFEEYPGIITSVAPCIDDDSNGLVVAITNLYDEDFYYSADTVIPLDKDGNEIGDDAIWFINLGSGNTMTEYIDTGDSIPDGRVVWEDVTLESPIGEAFGTYSQWKGNYKADLGEDNGMMEVSYDVESKLDADVDFGLVMFYMLDDEGNIVGFTCDYLDEVAAGSKAEGKVQFFNYTPGFFDTVKEVAMFANPTVTQEE